MIVWLRTIVRSFSFYSTPMEDGTERQSKHAVCSTPFDGRVLRDPAVFMQHRSSLAEAVLCTGPISVGGAGVNLMNGRTVTDRKLCVG